MKRKLYSFLSLICTFVISAVLLCGCSLLGRETSSSASESIVQEATVKASVLEKTGTMVVIKVEKAEEDTTLMDIMDLLKASGELDFKVVSGMVSELNGVANPADYSSCWMLYTSDAEMSNTAWGTVEYNGMAMGSAILGADTLTVIANAYYVWSFQSF
ncbi:MAG: hypothetical protein IKB20_01710 [Clostridia bacterium]|nr:hypothetical protein [Clostridia bacterium]